MAFDRRLRELALAALVAAAAVGGPATAAAPACLPCGGLSTSTPATIIRELATEPLLKEDSVLYLQIEASADRKD